MRGILLEIWQFAGNIAGNMAVCRHKYCPCTEFLMAILYLDGINFCSSFLVYLEYNINLNQSCEVSVTLFLQTFKTSLHPNRMRQRAEILRECSPPTTCHISGVTCHVAGVMCQKICFLFFGQSGDASCWRVCYPPGLPHNIYFFFYNLIRLG